MKRKVVGLCALGAYVLVACLCIYVGTYLHTHIPRTNVVEVGENGKFILTVTSTEWDGFSGKSWAEGRYVYDTELDKKYVVSHGDLGVSFTILSIDDESITIEANMPSGIDKDQFTITTEESYELATPTLDSGMIYVFSLSHR